MFNSSTIAICLNIQSALETASDAGLSALQRASVRRAPQMNAICANTNQSGKPFPVLVMSSNGLRYTAHCLPIFLLSCKVVTSYIHLPKASGFPSSPSQPKIFLLQCLDQLQAFLIHLRVPKTTPASTHTTALGGRRFGFECRCC